MSRHKFKPVEEWFIQADYDLATAKAMFKTARYIYTIFMCHLSIEKVELTNGIHRQLVKMTKKAVDIMYYSDLEWKRGHSLIITAAKEDGIAIYERT